ncbi:MAG: LLM class flavin-dependent oxidoreductase, partial [Bradyrhizobium sp.]
MRKQIRLNAFAMNCVAHQSPGLWTHPRDRTSEYHRLPYWTDLARTLERGRFDGLFLADVLGVYDVFGGSPDAALRNATQTPANEPLLLIPAMTAVTENLGFGVTSNLSYEPPYPFARRMSTLDHLTEGRIGEDAACPIAQHRIILPACLPELVDHLHIFVGDIVAVVMR